MTQAKSQKDKIKELAEKDFVVFAKLVNPSRVYGEVHLEVMRWLSADKASLDQLLLLPRGHMKSHLIAVWCAWHITNHPDTTILYVSATEDLATSQLYAIKNILESEVYRRYWPEMIHPEEAKREEWAAKNIMVDHPLRKERGVRDRTVAARSVGGNTTGLHCDVIVFDDIVVPQNAYTEDGRKKVMASYSQFSSIANAGAITKVVGTRYHGNDIYHNLMEMEAEEYDDEGNVTHSKKLFDTFIREVYDDTGTFLWPREQCPKSGKWFGFDNTTLAKIRAKYIQAGERAQYYAQYFNNPNDPESDRVDGTNFQYYERRYLTCTDDTWYYNGKPLAVFCAGDLAYTTNAKSDYTAFAVLGLDADGFIYILELDQFKTDKYDVYYKAIYRLWDKWRFKKCRIESNAGANIIVEYIKTEFRKDGAAIAVEGKQSRGEKVERAAAILEPRYASSSVFHYKGGYTSVYEEQLMLARPAHDDLKDAVSAAMEISKPPSARSSRGTTRRGDNIVTHERFGGRVR